MTTYRVGFQIGEQTPFELYDGDDYDTAYRLFDALSQVPIPSSTTLTATSRPDGSPEAIGHEQHAGKPPTHRARPAGQPVLPPKR